MCAGNKACLLSLVEALVVQIDESIPEAAVGSTNVLKQHRLAGPGKNLRIDEDYKEEVLNGRSHDGSATYARTFTSIDAQLPRDTGRQLAKGDVSAILQEQWLAYKDCQPDGVFAISEDSATLGNPGEDVECYAFWSARRKHAFWLVPQDALSSSS